MKRYYKDPYTTQARFTSNCAKCGHPIPKGTYIVYVPNEKKAYHTECGADIMDGLRAERSMDAYGTDIY